VWLEQCDTDVGGCAGDPDGGLRAAYLQRLTAFLDLLAARDLYVIFTLNEVPNEGGYGLANATACCEDFFGYNLSYLTEGGRIANRTFFRDVITGLHSRDAAVEQILAFELRNEPFMERNHPPFSRSDGLVTTANGATYDLSSDGDRRRMIDENMVDWIEDIAGVIRELSPTALVTIGYFHDLGPDSTWMAYVPHVVATSSLDCFAHHAYPEGQINSWEEYAESFRLDQYPASKPFVIGEFGVGKLTVPSPVDAAMMIQAWQVSSCDHGFDGWLHWTWGSGTADVFDLWAGTDAGGAVNDALSPALRPDPCQPGREMTDHDLLSFRAAVTASSSHPDFPPRKAVDLSMQSWWAAEPDGTSPQWLEIDLGVERTVGHVRIPIGHVTAAGATVIEVYGRGSGTGGTDELLHTFAQPVAGGMALQHSFPGGRDGIRHVRVVVTSMQHADGSEAWVVLHEVEVRGP
jgi:hypothetical protein